MSTFLTIYTPTHKRPEKLVRCMASVAKQTLAARIQHLIVPDYVGLGIGGMYGKVPEIKGAVQGEYVHFLADDDILIGSDAVEQLELFVRTHNQPEVVIVSVCKDGQYLPYGQTWPPICGQIDLGCLVVRRDIWIDHCDKYGNRYEGDFDFAQAVAASGHQALLYEELMFMRGDVLKGLAYSW